MPGYFPESSSLWWQSHAAKAIVTSKYSNSSNLYPTTSLDHQQEKFSLELWKKAFRDACERIAPFELEDTIVDVYYLCSLNWEIIANYADIIFANSDEAKAFCHFSSKESPVSATRYLSHFVPFVSVTDGPKGSYIGVKGEPVYIPPSPRWILVELRMPMHLEYYMVYYMVNLI